MELDNLNKPLFRTFICMEMSDEVVKEVARVQELVAKVKFIGKMTELENIHLTFKFLAEIDSEKMESVTERLRKIEFPVIDAKLDRIGVFGRFRHPKIVWIKVNGKGIWELQKKIDDSLKDLFRPEERFMSHMTIARIKYVRNSKETVEHIKKIAVHPISWKINKFILKTSELKPLGPIYTTVEEYILK